MQLSFPETYFNVVQAGLELLIFLSQPPKFWDSRSAPQARLISLF
jgi:hypothetical protein